MIYSPVSFDFARQIKGDKPVVVQFYTTWDGPSKAISPIFEKYSTEYGENVDFYRIDTDEVSEVVQEVGIRTVGTCVHRVPGRRDGWKPERRQPTGVT